MPPSIYFVYQSQFDAELVVIEPHPIRQMEICMLVESACSHRIKTGAWGYGFVRVAWSRPLLTWYDTDGTAVYLLSLQYDLLKVSGTV